MSRVFDVVGTRKIPRKTPFTVVVNPTMHRKDRDGEFVVKIGVGRGPMCEQTDKMVSRSDFRTPENILAFGAGFNKCLANLLLESRPKERAHLHEIAVAIGHTTRGFAIKPVRVLDHRKRHAELRLRVLSQVLEYKAFQDEVPTIDEAKDFVLNGKIAFAKDDRKRESLARALRQICKRYAEPGFKPASLCDR